MHHRGNKGVGQVCDGGLGGLGGLGGGGGGVSLMMPRAAKAKDTFPLHLTHAGGGEDSVRGEATQHINDCTVREKHVGAV